jgi:hypothetical protein
MPRTGEVALVVAIIALLLGAFAYVSITPGPNVPVCPAGQFLNNGASCWPSPFVKQNGGGGAISYQTLSDGRTYLTNTVYSSAFLSPQLYGLGVIPWITQNLAGYWPLDEDTGATTADLSGNGNTGTIVNSPTWITGQLSYALNFTSSSSQYVHAVSAVTTSGATSYTICAWFNLPSATTGLHNIIGSDQAGNNRMFELRYSGTDQGSPQRIQALQGTGAAVISVSSSSAITYGVWHLACFGYNGTSLFFYLDGVSQGTQAGGQATDGPIQLQIAHGLSGYLTGAIDDVRLYNIAITLIQATQLYNYGLQYSATNPKIIQATGMESFLPLPINASISGTSISWYAKWDNNAASANYAIFPMGAEDASGFYNGVDFSKLKGGGWTIAAESNGAATTASISTPTANTIHLFKIVFTTAGSQVDFYIDGSDVGTITTNVPTGLLSPFIEIDNYGTSSLIANLWGFGGEFP